MNEKEIKKKPFSISAERKEYLTNAIKDHGAILQEKKITAGFDGFIDTIVKIIKKKKQQKALSLFTTIKEFGNYISEKEGTSFSLELGEQNMRLGGNMPILSNALGQMGVPVNCVGALGYPQTHPVFKKISPNCDIYSFADPGTATAYEFADGKIMLAQMSELNVMGWDKIKSVLGIETLIGLYKESDMICILNWSEIDASTDIWKGLLKDVLPQYSFTAEKQIAFFDLSDCSKRNNKSIDEALQLLQEFAKHTKVILSLNKNEARNIYQVLYNKHAKKDFSCLGKKIFERIGIQTLLLHSAKEATAFTSDENVTVDTFFISDPKISTGAGDNFNAGFCAAQLLQLDLESSVILANAVSGYYVRTGTSAQLTDIIEFLETHTSL